MKCIKSTVIEFISIYLYTGRIFLLDGYTYEKCYIYYLDCAYKIMVFSSRFDCTCTSITISEFLWLLFPWNRSAGTNNNCLYYRLKLKTVAQVKPQVLMGFALSAHASINWRRMLEACDSASVCERVRKRVLMATTWESNATSKGGDRSPWQFYR